MRFYRWMPLGDVGDSDRCFLDDTPEGLDGRSFHLAWGRPVKGLYPQDPRIYLGEEYPGLRLESFVGNTKSMLVVSSALRALLEKWCQGLEVEYLPVHIYNHRKRLHSSDYSIINPLGTFDCLDQTASDVKRLGTEVIRLRRIVLSPEKLKSAPHLFRIPEDPTVYVVSEPLVKAIEAGGFTNVIFDELEISGT